MNAALCAACASEEPAPVLCHTCTEKCRRDLHTIGKARRMLDARPRRGRGGRPTGKPGSRPPADLTVLSMTDVRSRGDIDWETGEHGEDFVPTIDADILTEARLVIEAMQLSAPLRDWADCLRIINIHFDWCVRSARADEFAAVLSSCAGGLSAAIRDRERAVGRCLTVVDGSGTVCNGAVRLEYDDQVVLLGSDTFAPSRVSCRSCGSVWVLTPDNLVSMLRLTGLPEFPVEREWAGMVLGVRVKTITEWVRRGHVKGYADKQINLVDVLKRVEVL